MTGAGPAWGSGKGAGWRACAKNGERVQGGPAWVRDQRNKRTLWGFEINPSSNWRRQGQIARPCTFNAGWMVVDPAAPFHRVICLDCD